MIFIYEIIYSDLYSLPIVFNIFTSRKKFIITRCDY